MAEKNDGSDQKVRSWGERIRDAVGIKPQGKVIDAEDAVKKLKERKGRA